MKQIKVEVYEGMVLSNGGDDYLVSGFRVGENKYFALINMATGNRYDEPIETNSWHKCIAVVEDGFFIKREGE